jgi:hypothetical protein
MVFESFRSDQFLFPSLLKFPLRFSLINFADVVVGDASHGLTTVGPFRQPSVRVHFFSWPPQTITNIKADKLADRRQAHGLIDAA